MDIKDITLDGIQKGVFVVQNSTVYEWQ